MDITYAGGASFLIKGERVVAINPQEKKPSADVVLHSTRKDAKRDIADGPGEYEIGEVLVTTVRTGERGSTALSHAVTLANITTLHLASNVDKLDNAAVDIIGSVDILILNTDDLKAAQAAEKLLDARVVLPFGAHTSEFCTAIGAGAVEPVARFSWNGTATPPKVVVLKAPGTRRRTAA